MIPEGWRQVPLSNIAKSKIVYGIVQAGPHDPQGVPYLKSSDIGGQISYPSLQRTSQAIHSRYNRSTVRPGDIVISLRGNTGSTSIVPPDVPEANLTQGTARISVGDGFDRNFIHQQIASRAVQRLIQAATKGSTFVEITLDDLRKVEVLCPPSKQEQRQIAEILATWDRAIETVEGLIANARAQKMALMQSLLTGKRRLSGFSGMWSTKKLNHFCTIRRGASPRPITDPKWFAPTGRGWVRISDVTRSDAEFLSKTVQYLSPAGVERSVTVEPGELIMSICATIGVPKIVGIPVCIHDGFVLFRHLSPIISIQFLFYFLEFMTEKLASAGQPGTQKNLNTSIVGNIQFPDISKREQDDIAFILKLAANEIRDFKSQLEILRQEKSALMQQLLTGKRRVKITEKEAA